MQQKIKTFLFKNEKKALKMFHENIIDFDTEKSSLL